jgi:hypothetical protein
VIKHIHLILVEGLLLDVHVHESLSGQNLNANLVALEAGHLTLSHKDLGVVLVAAVSLQLLSSLQRIRPLVIDCPIVVKVGENTPVWRLMLLSHRGVLDLILLLKILDGGLSSLVELSILAEICFLLQVLDLILESALLSSLGVDAIDDLDEVLASSVLDADANIHIGLLLELQSEHWLLVSNTLLFGGIFLLLALTTESEHLYAIIRHFVLLHHVVFGQLMVHFGQLIWN